MDKLEHKDNLNTVTYGAILENKMLYEYLAKIDQYVMKYRQNNDHNSAVALATETARLIDYMTYLSDNTLTKLLEIQDLNNIEIEEDKVNAKNDD